MSISPKGESQEDMGLNGICHKLRVLDARFLTQHRVLVCCHFGSPKHACNLSKPDIKTLLDPVQSSLELQSHFVGASS